ncbi:hypothetical protein HDU79_004366 [Rhizoclosmatium sp. JEL0117]|nr:hypothetical protein HDU79_004366 [Rhizoclosmatium sp. JEL0117]
MPQVHIATKIGAVLFLIWGILHLWVPYDAFHNFHEGGLEKAVLGIAGGPNSPLDKVQVPTDAATANLMEGLIKNFVLDVGGYGVLGVAVAFKLWTEGDLFAFLLGLVVIGIADMSFLYFLVVPGGVIDLKFEVVLGPLLWFLAIIVTPVGLFYGAQGGKNSSKTKKKVQ